MGGNEVGGEVGDLGVGGRVKKDGVGWIRRVGWVRSVGKRISFYDEIKQYESSMSHSIKWYMQWNGVMF